MKKLLPQNVTFYKKKLTLLKEHVKVDRRWQLGSLIVLFIGLFLTVFALQRLQDTRSRASDGSEIFGITAEDGQIEKRNNVYFTTTRNIRITRGNLGALLANSKGGDSRLAWSCPNGFMCMNGLGSGGKLSDTEVQGLLSCENPKQIHKVYECGRGDAKAYRMCWNDYTQVKNGSVCLYKPTTEGQLYQCQEYDDIADVPDPACKNILKLRSENNDWDNPVHYAYGVGMQIQYESSNYCDPSMVVERVPLTCDNGTLSFHQYSKGALTGCLSKSGNLSDASIDASQTVKPQFCGLRTTPGTESLPNSYRFRRVLEGKVGEDWLIWMAGMFKNGIFPGVDNEEDVIYYSEEAFRKTYCKENGICPIDYVDYSMSQWRQKALEDYTFFDTTRIMAKDLCFDMRKFYSNFPEVVEEYGIGEGQIQRSSEGQNCVNGKKNVTEEELKGALLMTALSQHYASGTTNFIRLFADSPLFNFMFGTKLIADWYEGYNLTAAQKAYAIYGVLSWIPREKAARGAVNFAKLLKDVVPSKAAAVGKRISDALGRGIRGSQVDEIIEELPLLARVEGKLVYSGDVKNKEQLAKTFGEFIGEEGFGAAFVDRAAGKLTKIFKYEKTDIDKNQIEFYKKFGGQAGISKFYGEVYDEAGNVVGFQQEFISNAVALETFYELGGTLTQKEVNAALANLKEIYRITGQAHGDLISTKRVLHPKNVLIQVESDGSKKVRYIDFGGVPDKGLAGLPGLDDLKSIEYMEYEYDIVVRDLQKLVSN